MSMSDETSLCLTFEGAIYRNDLHGYLLLYVTKNRCLSHLFKYVFYRGLEGILITISDSSYFVEIYLSQIDEIKAEKIITSKIIPIIFSWYGSKYS